METLVLNLSPCGGGIPRPETHARTHGEPDEVWDALVARMKVDDSATPADVTADDSPLLSKMCYIANPVGMHTGGFQDSVAAIRKEYGHMRRLAKRPWPEFLAALRCGAPLEAVDLEIIRAITGLSIACLDMVGIVRVSPDLCDAPLDTAVTLLDGSEGQLFEVVRRGRATTPPAHATQKRMLQWRATMLAISDQGTVQTLKQRVAMREAEFVTLCLDQESECDRS